MPSVLESITSPAFKDRLAEIIRTEPDATVLSYMLSPAQQWHWGHSVGVARDAKLAKLVPPLPPEKLRALTAAPDAPTFLWTGLADLQTFMDVFARHGTAPAGRKLRVFDFGCGAGRMTRFLGMMDAVEAHASEINPDMAKWCRENLKTVVTTKNEELPPLSFADGAFDFVYSMSIFTHLSEERTRPWLDEMARVLAPGGILAVTTHAHTALGIIKGSKVHQDMFGVDAAQTAELQTRLETERFIFLPYKFLTRTMAKVGSEYGNSFIHPAYIDAKWNTDTLEVLAHQPGGLRGWQDMVVLRRKG
ncbi:MAG: class I SAM-dependent methyltransferase [Rhodospirillaceae bacterium]|nr:class I SAM-dependent methyltransferase [Rhodospirillaceae bacterium]